MAQFRFQNLEIWKRTIEIADKLLDIADEMDERKFFRFSDQFLNFAKRSCFENANMLILFCKRGLISGELRDSQLKELEEESKMIEAFRKSLFGGSH